MDRKWARRVEFPVALKKFAQLRGAVAMVGIEMRLHEVPNERGIDVVSDCSLVVNVESLPRAVALRVAISVLQQNARQFQIELDAMEAVEDAMPYGMKEPPKA